MSLGDLPGFLARTSAAAPPSEETCWDCHEGKSRSSELVAIGRLDSLHLTSSLYAASVHAKAGISCIQCHAGIAAIPHGDLTPVRCGECHEAEFAEHARSIHGVAQANANPDAPGCVDCHGTHGILSAADSLSPTHSFRQPATCARCHAEPGLVERNEIRGAAPLDVYLKSVHGRALLVDRNEKAPSCATCHGAHDVQAPTDARSRVAKAHVPATCGECHVEVEAVFRESVHGAAVISGNSDAPACNDCHGEHQIEPASSPTSLVYPANLARTTCVRCHESEILAQRYGFAADRGATFRETYHGLATQLGGLPVANCASCHGVHNIYPSSDPRSTIFAANLQATCGSCHPSASDTFTQIAVHGPATVGPKHPAARIARSVYIVLLVVVIGGMGLHNVILWTSYVARKYRRERSAPRVLRFTRFEVIEHAILTASFVGLVVTGFALKYSDAFWVHWLSRMGLDELLRRNLHRGFGVVLIGVSLVHGAFLLFTKRGRTDLGALRPAGRDLREFFDTMLYHLGRREAKPRRARFDYAEKLEYLALIWGTVIMAVTGIILWYPANFTRWAPAWVVEVSEVLHFYEAWLAFLAIVVWHFFFVIFHPEEFPLNTTVLDGRVSHEKAAERDSDPESGAN